jgi:hypothetical protein
MFLLLLGASTSRKPIFLVPGLAASALNGTVTGSPIWYCPRTLTNELSG